MAAARRAAGHDSETRRTLMEHCRAQIDRGALASRSRLHAGRPHRHQTDLGTPLITTGSRAHCDTTETPIGQTLTITGWTLRVLAWTFATLFIAGFTDAVRKT